MKNILAPVMIAAVVLFSSCSDWTQSENIVINRPTPQEQDPEAYAQYLVSVRNYKKSEHMISMATMRGTSEAPSRQNQHLTSMPDSLDYISLTNVANLHSMVQSEMTTVRKDKGTKVLCVVDYMSIETAWIAAQGDDGFDGTAEQEAESFAAFCKEETGRQLSYCDEYGFDGIQISYLGNTTELLGETGQKVFIESIEEWRTGHLGKEMFFRGYMRNLQDNTILKDCKYLIAVAGTASDSNQLTLEVQRQIVAGVPTDRFIIEVTIPDALDPEQIGATAKVAANWILVPNNNYDKIGLSVHNAHEDYFNVDLIYKNTREAIAIMSAGI